MRDAAVVRKRKRRRIVAPRTWRRRPRGDDEEFDADELVLGPGEKPSGEG